MNWLVQIRGQGIILCMGKVVQVLNGIIKQLSHFVMRWDCGYFNNMHTSGIACFFCIQKSDDRSFIKICQYTLWRGVIKKNLWPDSCRSRLRFTEHLPHGGIETLFFDRSAAICAHSKSQGRQAWLRLYGISVSCSEIRNLWRLKRWQKKRQRSCWG